MSTRIAAASMPPMFTQVSDLAEDAWMRVSGAIHAAVAALNNSRRLLWGIPNLGRRDSLYFVGDTRFAFCGWRTRDRRGFVAQSFSELFVLQFHASPLEKLFDVSWKRRPAITGMKLKK